MLILLVSAAAALVAVPLPPTASARVISLEVPQDKGAQEVQVLTREFPVGGSSGWHTHPGVEIGHVVSGVTEMHIAGAAPRRYSAGETFVIPRGVVRNGVQVVTVIHPRETYKGAVYREVGALALSGCSRSRAQRSGQVAAGWRTHCQQGTGRRCDQRALLCQSL